MDSQKLGLPPPRSFRSKLRLTTKQTNKKISTVCRKLQSIARLPSQRARSASPAQRAHPMAPAKNATPTNRGRSNDQHLNSSFQLSSYRRLLNKYKERLLICPPCSCIAVYQDQLTHAFNPHSVSATADKRSDSPVPSTAPAPLTRSASLSKKASLLKTSSVRAQVNRMGL